MVLDVAFPAPPGHGDYYLRPAGAPETALRRITGLSGTGLTLESPLADGLPAKGGKVDLVVRLSRSFCGRRQCIGCGMCEHECPVSGQHAIRVYAKTSPVPAGVACSFRARRP